jgi:hypothetical protein
MKWGCCECVYVRVRVCVCVCVCVCLYVSSLRWEPIKGSLENILWFMTGGTLQPHKGKYFRLYSKNLEFR